MSSDEKSVLGDDKRSGDVEAVAEALDGPEEDIVEFDEKKDLK